MSTRIRISELRRVVAEELYPPHVNHRLLLAQQVIALLPHGMFPRVRTALYRLGGVEIGHGSVIVGKLRLWGRVSSASATTRRSIHRAPSVSMPT